MRLILTIAVLPALAILMMSVSGCGQKGPLIALPGQTLRPAGPTAPLPPGAQSPTTEGAVSTDRDAPTPTR